jgi:hypothetical protein
MIAPNYITYYHGVPILFDSNIKPDKLKLAIEMVKLRDFLDSDTDHPLFSSVVNFLQNANCKIKVVRWKNHHKELTADLTHEHIPFWLKLAEETEYFSISPMEEPMTTTVVPNNWNCLNEWNIHSIIQTLKWIKKKAAIQKFPKLKHLEVTLVIRN